MTDTLFGGPATDGELRRWQMRNLVGLTELVKLGEKKKLPVLFWTLASLGSVIGKVESHRGVRHPRAVFELWHTALGKDPRVEPRGLGLREDQPPLSEWTNNGKTNLLGGFYLNLPSRARVSVAIVAEWYADEFPEAGGK